MPTLTITTTAQQAQRVADSFGKYYSLRDANDNQRAATEAEVKQYLVGYMKEIVRSAERKAAADAIADAPFDPT